MITGDSSNSGKTTLSLGLTRALKNRGLDISPFKTGPDFIDSKYLSVAAKKTAGNLDIYMMGKEGIKESLSINLAEYGLIEGAMGYFDGIYNTYENSSFHISEELDIPVILVYSPRGEMFSAIPKIKGMVDFAKGRIKGIILNKTSEKLYPMFKEQIEEYIDIGVVGYVPKTKELEIEEKYLGLDQPYKNKDLDRKLDLMAGKVEETLDMEKIISLFKNIEVEKYKYPEKKDIRVAIAYDQAFNFYYEENLKLLDRMTETIYFSPLNDTSLPKVDLLYLGGGYPELYRKELSNNKSMIRSIKKFGENGGYIYGEGGGLIYLLDRIEDSPMLGLIDGQAIITGKLERFGYIDIELEKDTILGKKGDRIRGKEYHRSRVETEAREIYKISKPKSRRKWKCGYQKNNILGGYPHIHFLGNLKALDNLLDIR